MLVLLLAALDQTIVATALPTIVADLGDVSKLSWGTVASTRKASPTRTEVEADCTPSPRERLKEADRECHLRRSGLQVEDSEGADRQMQQCRGGAGQRRSAAA